MSASGNVIVVAGAGTGKTHKLVQTCLEQIRQGARIDEMLIVTFTKAAAAELRGRIAKALNEAFEENPNDAHIAQQIALLDRAQISTLHSFCLELVSRNFSELGLAPRLTTLEAAQSAALESEALDAQFEIYYEAQDERAKLAKKFLLEWFHGDDVEARRMIRKIHSHTQALPEPAKWFAEQRALFSGLVPESWRRELDSAIQKWADEWRPLVEKQSVEKNNARGLILKTLADLNVIEAAGLADQDLWPHGTKKFNRDPLKLFFAEAKLLAAWKTPGVLEEDWELARAATLELLRMAEEFGAVFSDLKRERALVDFNDLEQFSLRLLWEDGRPSAVAEQSGERLKCIFVDEYQDINRAQDKIIEALARGNRFLVGDVKQSIYGFRQAEPQVFQGYETNWSKGDGKVEYLVRNWRSHERILDFVNALFTGIMTQEAGGINYDDKARLQFADEPKRFELSAKHDSAPKVEVHLIEADEDDSDEANPLAQMAAAEGEAEVIAELCAEIVRDGRGGYGDIVILMRSAAEEVEAFAKTFSRRGIPFDARRTGFFNCIEVLDLNNLLTILDNPLQDIPLLGVLRSPIGCFSLEELAQVRLGLRRGAFWEALRIFATKNPESKAASFIKQIQKWRDLSRQTSLAQRLEMILEETGYEDWVAAQERGAQRRANVRRFIELARQFDEIQGEGLYPFLKYMEEQIKAVGDLAPAPVESHGAVRLMTVHQSKGLQFPIVIVAGLRKGFNKGDLNGHFLLEAQSGLCLKARPPGARKQYETLAFWLAKQRLERRLLDEEMRILYVALTRAEKQMILVAAPRKAVLKQWRTGEFKESANSMLDWIGPWLSRDCPAWLEADSGAAAHWKWRRHGGIQAETTTEVSPDNFTAPEIILSKLRERLEWKYPFEGATVQEAKSSATALRRALADEPELARPFVKRKPGALHAQEAGQATHRFLEEAVLETFSDAKGVQAELKRLKESGSFSEAEAQAIDAKKIYSFWSSEFGKKLLEDPTTLRRELIFTAKFTAADLKTAGAPVEANFGADEFIVVQGAADLVSLREKEIWLVDFKTDRLPKARLDEYEVQLRIYALALERIYKRRVTHACLHFLETGLTHWVRHPGYLPLM